MENCYQRLLLAAVVLLAAAVAVATPAAAQTFTEFPIPTANSEPIGGSRGLLNVLEQFPGSQVIGDTTSG
jgi:hypothetical protein